MSATKHLTYGAAAHRPGPAHNLQEADFLRLSDSTGNLSISKHCDFEQGPPTPPEKGKQRPRPKRKDNSHRYPPLSPFQQVSPSHSSSDLHGAAVHSDNGHLADDRTDAHAASPAWYSESKPAADDRSTEAESVPSSALAALQNMATTVGNSFALWGSYITEFVADVAGDEPTEEEIAAAEKQKQAAKEASKKNQGSVTGDFAQPLTRRHSRSSSGCLSRGASLRLDGDWLISPTKSTLLSDLQTPHKQDAEHGEFEGAKKDS